MIYFASLYLLMNIEHYAIGMHVHRNAAKYSKYDFVNRAVKSTRNITMCSKQ